MIVFAGIPGYAEVRATAPSAGAAQAIIDTFLATAGLDPWKEPPANTPSSGGNSPARLPSPPDQGAAADRTPATANQPSDASGSASDALAARISALEAHIQRDMPLPLRAFLSYRFAQPAGELDASKILRFLSAMGVQAVSGTGYEPRRVSEKVADRLTGVDLLVLVIAGDGESPWTRDEIANARTQGIAVIPLVQEGQQFAPGMFGDLEYVTYAEGHIGDTFLALAEAVVWVREHDQRRA